MENSWYPSSRQSTPVEQLVLDLLVVAGRSASMWRACPRCNAGGGDDGPAASTRPGERRPSRPGDAIRAPSTIKPIELTLGERDPDVGGACRRGWRVVDPQARSRIG